jgi:hypothetical protein
MLRCVTGTERCCCQNVGEISVELYRVWCVILMLNLYLMKEGRKENRERERERVHVHVWICVTRTSTWPKLS